MSDSGRDVDRRLQDLLARHAPALAAAAARSCPGWLGIGLEEFTQEIRIRLWQALAARPELDPNAAYLFRIAATAAIDLIRRRRSDGSLLPIEALSPSLLQQLAIEDSAWLAQQSSERSQQLLAGLAQLDVRRATVLRLYLQGFSLQEIAELSGISQDAARNLVYRAADDLKHYFRQQSGDDST